MGTAYGFGSGYRGWRFAPQGTCTATLWILAFHVPIVPLERVRLRKLERGDAEPHARAPLLLAADLLSGWTGSDPVEILERTPLRWREVARTYLWTFAGVPALCLWPVLLARQLYRDWLPERGIELPQAAHLAIACFVLANLACVLLVAAHRASGPSRATTSD